MAFQFNLAQPPNWNVTFLQTLTTLGLATNLKLVLDASDSLSYTSGQKWLDRAGSGYDFFRGVDGSASADDPTFNGTAGGQSLNEYWSFDGGDFFRYDTTNESWMDNLHKNNAKFSFACWLYPPSPFTSRSIFGTGGIADLTKIGMWLHYDVSGKMGLDVLNGTGSAALSTLTSDGGNSNAWNFMGGAIDEGANVQAYTVNGAQVSNTCTYSSPSAAAATYKMEVAGAGNGEQALTSGSRMACLAVWEGRALTNAEMLTIYAATRGKFNI